MGTILKYFIAWVCLQGVSELHEALAGAPVRGLKWIDFKVLYVRNPAKDGLMYL